MTILDIDFGNTRLKWRLANAGTVLAESAVYAAGPDSSADWSDGFASQVEAVTEKPVRARVASVRDARTNARLDTLLAERWGLVAEYATVTGSSCGVTNSYGEVHRMGVDRWLAMLAAFDQVGGECCIVNAGSALTIDFIASDGQHLGGYIVPGLTMMLDALRQRSEALRFSGNVTWQSVSPGTDTRESIEHGLLAMMTGWLQSLARQYPGCRWLVSGGDGDKLLPHIQPAEYRPSLVLEGLALAIP